MKTVIAVAVTALVTASGTVAGGQFVDRGARAQAHAALVQAKQAKASVRALNVRVQDLEINAACFNGSIGATGYYYPVTDWAGFPYNLYALDTTHTGDPVHYNLATVDPGCAVTVQQFHTSRAPARIAP